MATTEPITPTPSDAPPALPADLLIAVAEFIAPYEVETDDEQEDDSG